MKKSTFKTNIMCGDCIGKVTPYLNELETIDKWEVDLSSPDKTLEVESEKIDASEIIHTLQRAGYQAEEIRSWDEMG